MTNTKQIKKVNKGGHPVKWTEEKCIELAGKLIKFFVDFKAEFKKDKTLKEVPFLSEFCRNNDVSQDTLTDKAKIYEELGGALKKAKEIQKEILIMGGLDGRFNPTAFIFTAKNITDMRDKTETDVTSGGKVIPILGGLSVSKDNSNK